MEIINDLALSKNLTNKYAIKNIFDMALVEDLLLMKYNKGEFICYEGEPLKYLHFMVEGKIKVNDTQENGKSRLLCFLQDFEILGHIELFADTDYSTNVEAVTDVYCFALSLPIYKEKLFNDAKFLRYSAKKLAKTLLINNENASFNLLYPLETRLATYILLTADDGKFHDNLTTLAELLTTSYRHLTRVLSNLCEKGILVKTPKYYEIAKLEDLRNISNQSVTHL